jgi:hypothetical protein
VSFSFNFFISFVSGLAIVHTILIQIPSINLNDGRTKWTNTTQYLQRWMKSAID